MRVLFLLIFLWWPTNVFAQSIHEIEWLSENFPPFNYVDENNIPQGLYIDILEQMWKRTGIRKSKEDIRMFPWARGIQMLDKGAGTSLFAMGMTEERLKRYKFVGPVKSINVGIIAKKSKNFRFNSISEINQTLASKRLGAVRDDSGHRLFVDAGGKSDLLYLSVQTDSMIRMLELDRLDAISLVNITAFWEMKEIGIDSNQYELVYLLTLLPSGFAFHKDTEQSAIDQLQDAFDSLYEEGTIKTIEDRYLQ